MALSNAEKQKNWRERHIERRRTVQRISGLLLRRTWSDEHFETLGGLLQQNREAARALRRALKPRTNEEMEAIHRENEKGIQAWWLKEHPGRTRAEYNRLLRDIGGGRRGRPATTPSGWHGSATIRVRHFPSTNAA